MSAFRIAAWPAHPGLRLYPQLYLDPGCLGAVPVSFYPLPFLFAIETWSMAELRGRPGGCTGRRQASGHCFSTLSLQDNPCLFGTGVLVKTLKVSSVLFFSTRWWQAARHGQLRSLKTLVLKIGKARNNLL